MAGIKFEAVLHRPAEPSDADWTFLNLPQEASDQLASRSMVSVEGTFSGVPFKATLEPDGQGGHWMKVKGELRSSAQAAIGQPVELEIAPAAVEPEPEVPDDLQAALDASSGATATWHATTALARRDWIHWITSGKKAETRVKRVEVAISKLESGKKRACCFDRSGMYSNSMSCPVAADE